MSSRHWSLAFGLRITLSLLEVSGLRLRLSIECLAAGASSPFQGMTVLAPLSYFALADIG
jgi:hypothetical protein